MYKKTKHFFLTSPASKVSRTTFLRDVATEVVGQDHHEPLGSQLVAPLPRPESHFKHDATDLVELRITKHLSLVLRVISSTIPKIWWNSGSPSTIESPDVVVPDHTRPAVPLSHRVDLEAGLKINDLDGSVLSCYSVFIPSLSPFPVARKQSCCKLEEKRSCR